MNNPFEIVKEAAKKLLPKSWEGFHSRAGNKSKVAVTHVDCGLNPLKRMDWVSVVFVEEGVTHKLMGKMPVASSGKQGGADVIQLDGQDVAGADVVIGLHFEILKLKAEAVLAYKTTTDRYEFTAEIPFNF